MNLIHLNYLNQLLIQFGMRVDLKEVLIILKMENGNLNSKIVYLIKKENLIIYETSILRFH